MKKGVLIKCFSIGFVALFVCITSNPTIGVPTNFDDTTAPVTNISFDPVVPNGCNGWYISNVTVILNATDDISGVNATFYRINGLEWYEYIFPFVICEEGENILIEFFSVDNVGNVEVVKSVALDIDKTPPQGTIGWEVHRIGWKKWIITFYVNITDEANGLVRVEYYLNGLLMFTATGPGPTYSWIFTLYKIPKIEIKIIAYDNACNNATFIINGSNLHFHPKFYDSTYCSNHIWFFLLQHLLDILRWYN